MFDENAALKSEVDTLTLDRKITRSLYSNASREIERLMAEVSEFKLREAGYDAVIRSADCTIKVLTTEVEQLREDAERLDFLDSNRRFRMGWSVKAAPVGNLSITGIIMGGLPIRDAIDAAMEGTK